MDIIKPLVVTNSILTSSDVPEDDYDEWKGVEFLSLSQTARFWLGFKGVRKTK